MLELTDYVRVAACAPSFSNVPRLGRGTKVAGRFLPHQPRGSFAPHTLGTGTLPGTTLHKSSAGMPVRTQVVVWTFVLTRQHESCLQMSAPAGMLLLGSGWKRCKLA